MPIGYNPDVINPGGIDYAELTDLVNPPNSANAGKTIVIGSDGKPTLGEGGGGGGGSVGVLYTLDADPAQTDPAIPESVEITNSEATPVSTTQGGTAMTYSELRSYFSTHDIIVINEISGAGEVDHLYPIRIFCTNGYDEEQGRLCAAVYVASGFESLSSQSYGIDMFGEAK